MLTILVWAFFGALYSVPLFFISSLSPVLCCPHYYIFELSFEISLCESSNFLPFNIALAILALLFFNVNYRMR